MLSVLLLHRLRLWRNQTFPRPRRTRRLLLLLLYLALGLAFFRLVYQFSFGFFALLARLDPALATSSLSLVFAGVVVLALSSGVSAILHQLYLSSDLDLLLAAPVSIRDLFLLKLAEAWYAASLGGVLSLAALVGYGRALEMPLAFWPLALLLAGVVTLTTAALAMVLVMLAVRIMPVRRAEGIVALLGGVLVAMIWFLFQTVNAGGRGSSPLQLDPEQMSGLEPLVGRWCDATWWTPAAWAADALLAVGEGRWPTLALNLSMLGGTTGGLAALAYLVFRKSFYLGWERLREVALRGASPRRQRKLRPNLLCPVPSPMRAIILKDWRTLPRDLKLLSGLIMPLVVLTFFGFTSLRGRPADSPSPTGFWLAMLPMSVIPFLLALGLSSRAFGMEGRSFALLRTAPLTIGQMMVAKLVAGYLPILALVWAAAIALAIGHGGSMTQIAAALGVFAWLTAGVVAACVGGGAMATNFEADNPQKSVGCLGTTISLVAASLFLVANIGILAWLVLGAPETLPPGLLAGQPIGAMLTAGVVVSVAVIAGVAWFGANTLGAWEGK